jgi:hypothetical protein
MQTVYKSKYDTIKSKVDAINIYKKHLGVVRLREIGETVYKKHLDIMPAQELQRLGGELTGLYVSFGNSFADARAEHEISENIYKQVLSAITQANLDAENHEYKVTEAKNLALLDLEEELSDILVKEATYKQWENVMDTTKTLIMFIQSTLAFKKSEQFISKDNYNN